MAITTRHAQCDLHSTTDILETPLAEFRTLRGRHDVVDAIGRDGDVFEVLHVLAEQVGVRAVFSDWPATVTYYANCLDID